MQFPHTPRTGEAEVAQVEQGRDTLFLTSKQSRPRLVASFCSSLRGCCLLPPPLPEVRELPASSNSPSQSSWPEQHWETWAGLTFPAPVSCRAIAVCHHPAPCADVGWDSASAGFWERHGSSEGSQACLGAQHQPVPRRFGGCPRAGEASGHIWQGLTTQAQEDKAERLKFPCAPCPLSQPR